MYFRIVTLTVLLSLSTCQATDGDNYGGAWGGGVGDKTTESK